MTILDRVKAKHSSENNNSMPIMEYLEICKSDPDAYATPAQRLLRAIGSPSLMDTSQDPRLGRIFQNRVIKVYDSFSDFYGIESTIEAIVGYVKHAAQGLEESRQILYLLGPVGSAKSSLAERIMDLMEREPFYAIEGSPVFESPLPIFRSEYKEMESEWHIPRAVLEMPISPWLVEKLKELDGDVSKLRVVKLYPSKDRQVALARVEPGDENNQDISHLVGKVDIRRLQDYPQSHAYAYSFSGGLCRANRGVLNFIEMFKAPIKMLNPLLTSTQEKAYTGTESIGVIPFDGVIIAHSNEGEWEHFRNDKTNEAFIDRVYLIRTPYCLRYSEEIKIYKKMLENSLSLSKAVIAPHTLESLAQFSAISRLKEIDDTPIHTKLKVYDGENVKEKDPKAKSYQEYRDRAGVDEGMNGISTRFAFKALAKTLNFDPEEIAANPVHLFMVLKDLVLNEQFGKDFQAKLLNLVDSYLQTQYFEFLEKELRSAYLDSYAEYGQNLFERYLALADAWLMDADFRDPQTGQVYDRDTVNKELEVIEKPAGISNPKDFRSEVVNFALRYKASKGRQLPWTSYERVKDVIEKKLFSMTQDILPVISFSKHASEEDEKKHQAFLQRMMEFGYTEKQVKILVDWWARMSKSK